jgi:hypothetical protein
MIFKIQSIPLWENYIFREEKLFKKIIAVYSENQMSSIIAVRTNTKC